MNKLYNTDKGFFARTMAKLAGLPLEIAQEAVRSPTSHLQIPQIRHVLPIPYLQRKSRASTRRKPKSVTR